MVLNRHDSYTIRYVAFMSDFEKYKVDLFDFENNQDSASYAERVGPPEELPAVIGLISINFQHLDDTLSSFITRMTNVEDEIGSIITSELSFRNKQNLFASLYYQQKDEFEFNTFPGNEAEYFKELLKALNKCEEFRNKILHSTIIKDYESDKIKRIKITAKSKKGLTLVNQDIDIPYLFNISDSIISMQMELEEFFIGYKRKNAT